MNIAETIAGLDIPAIGRELHERIRRLYPINRSISGDGVRETLRVIADEIELQTIEVPSGTKVFDWTVPREWNIRDAYIKSRDGTRIVDFKASNLHVVSYSVPVHARLTLLELRPHLFSIPELRIGFRTRPRTTATRGGFACTHRQLESMQDDEYEVCIDSSLENGHLTLAECLLPGRESTEVLFSAHICHPSLCNDNLSGVALVTRLAELLSTATRSIRIASSSSPGRSGPSRGSR